jgi:hypothetical protein
MTLCVSEPSKQSQFHFKPSLKRDMRDIAAPIQMLCRSSEIVTLYLPTAQAHLLQASVPTDTQRTSAHEPET